MSQKEVITLLTLFVTTMVSARQHPGINIGIRMSYGKNQTLRSPPQLKTLRPLSNIEISPEEVDVSNGSGTKHASNPCSGPIFMLGCR